MKRSAIHSKKVEKKVRAMDLQLYDYLSTNLTAISDEWLAQREVNRGSIYSIDAGGSAELLLREQNRLTNLTVTSILLNDKEVFESNKEKWAREVAESRVESNTPIPEVLDALSKARQVYWTFVERFLKSKVDEITKDDLLRWGIAIHMAFDELYIHFSEMYYQITSSERLAQQNLIAELSFPIIKLNTSIGVLPLIGNIDAIRGKSFLECIPAKSVKMEITHLFIDLSGVSIIDTMVAQQIYPIIQILKLLGIDSTLTGIRPEIAQTSVQLGINFANVATFSSLQQALKNQLEEII